MSQPNPFRSLVLDGAIADESSGIVDVSSFTNIVVYLTGTGTTSSGVITIAEADDRDIAIAKWSAITTVNASAISAGVTSATHLTVGAYGYLLIRVSTVIGGGGSIAAVVRAI